MQHQSSRRKQILCKGRDVNAYKQNSVGRKDCKGTDEKRISNKHILFSASGYVALPCVIVAETIYKAF